MKIVVGSMSTKLQEFLRKYQFNSRVTVIHKMCNVKLIKEPSDVIIPFGVINEYEKNYLWQYCSKKQNRRNRKSSSGRNCIYGFSYIRSYSEIIIHLLEKK